MTRSVFGTGNSEREKILFTTSRCVRGVQKPALFFVPTVQINFLDFFQFCVWRVTHSSLHNCTIPHSTVAVACLHLSAAVVCVTNALFHFQDSAVVGEAAALGIGMVMLGSADKEICQELMEYGQVCCHVNFSLHQKEGISIVKCFQSLWNPAFWGYLGERVSLYRVHCTAAILRSSRLAFSTIFFLIEGSRFPL